MKITFPHMGRLYIALSTAIKILGGDVVIPPYNNKRTLELGSLNSPEAICFPYKLVLGNYMQAIENGADAVLMIDSPGICRLGQYSSSLRTTITDLGYNVKFINFDLYKGKLKELYVKFREATGNRNPITLVRAINMALLKINILDDVDKILSYYRARELKEGDADKRYLKGLREIEAALGHKEALNAKKNTIEYIKSTPIDPDKEIVTVDLVGEIFVVLDQFSNLDIEKELGRLGVHVNRQINLSDWVKASIIPSFLRFGDTHEEKARKSARTFLKRDVGGDAIESIGDVALAGKQHSADGVIHLLPFTCMPEIVAQNILPNVRYQQDIPVLSLVLDEHMGRAGYITRLEAFVDLLKRRKRQAGKSLKVAVNAG